MLYTLADINRLFTATTLARGRAYYKQGRVRSLTVTTVSDRDYLIAEVAGSEPQPYQVTIEIESRRDGRVAVKTDCTCPVGHACKHAAAALLQALDGDRKPAAGRRIVPVVPPVAPVTSPTAPIALSDAKLAADSGATGPLAQWFQRLSSAAQPTPVSDYPPLVRDRLLYVLHLNPFQVQGLEIKLVVARLLKDGGYGQPRNYNPQLAVYGQAPQYITPTDVAILRDLTLQKTYSTRDRLIGAEGAALLERMLATGRCHWESQDSPALSVGEPRPARLDWQTDNQGLSQLRLAVEPAGRVLLLDPLWYVDPDQRLAGLATLALPVPLALELVTSPPLRPDELPQVVSWLQNHLPTIPVPPPPALKVVNLELPPQPVLRLCTREIQRYYETTTVDAAQVVFDYAGEVVAVDDPLVPISRYQDDQVVRIARQPTIEQARLKRLTRLGFKRLNRLYSNQILAHQHLTRGFGLPDQAAWVHFMSEDAPRLQDEGWRLELEDGFRWELAMADSWYAELAERGEGGMDWFGLALGVEINGQPVNLLPVLVNFLRKQPPAALQEGLRNLADDESLLLTLPDGRLLPVPAARLRGILNVLIELYDQPTLDSDGNLRLPRLQAVRLAELEAVLYGEPLRWHGGEALRTLAERLRTTALSEVPSPPGLTADLRHYQQRGLAWLQYLRECELGGILADDMGLGKTVQALAHLLVEKTAGRLDRPSLVVAPTSLMANWRDEAARFAPDLRVLILQGPDRRERFAAIPEHDLILTTYALLPRDCDTLLAHEYHLLILDEAQAIKNPKAQAGLVARSLKARHRLCLTGTPMENHLGELWSLFDLLLPGLLGDEREFRRLFRRPIEQFGDNDRRNLLVRRIAPFMLRRTKEQVAPELPPKTEIIRTTELHGSQRDLYESIRVAMQDKVREAVQRQGLARSQIVILDALLRLRQVCCDPRLLKLAAAKPFKSRQSAKLDLLLELLTGLLAEERHILLFSQFTSMLALIEAELERLGIAYVKLTGSTQDRATPVARFQAGAVPLFLISLKAGGTGLNLTAADTVIHYDPWWNPAVEDQATDRAYRIGQDKPVFVYKLFTEGTVEVKIRELQARKRALLNGVLATEGAEQTRWTEQDLEFLFAPLH